MSHNIETKVTNGKLHVVIDLNAEVYESSTGKTYILASTQGNTQISGRGVPDGLKLGINAYVPKTS